MVRDSTLSHYLSLLGGNGRGKLSLTGHTHNSRGNQTAGGPRQSPHQINMTPHSPISGGAQHPDQKSMEVDPTTYLPSSFTPALLLLRFSRQVLSAQP